MSKALGAIAIIFLISVIVPNCHGILKLDLDGRIMVSTFTPYLSNGTVNLDLVPKLAEYFAKRKIKNIQILAFYGEGPSIGLETKKLFASAWAKETKRLGQKLVVEVGGMPFLDQLELAKYCSQLNVTAISAFPQIVYEAENYEEIIEDYQRLSEAAPYTPLMYRDLSQTGPIITPAQAVVEVIQKVKTFVGGVITMDAALDVKAALPSVDGFQLIIFGNKNIATALAANMNVSVTNIVNLCPKLALAIEAAVDAGNIYLALDLQQQGNRLLQAITSNMREVINYNARSYFIYLRATFRIFTGMDLGSRLPFNKISSADLERIRNNLKEYEDFIKCYCS